MIFPKHKYSIWIGAWTLTQWFKYSLVLLGVLGAATYISNSEQRQFLVYHRARNPLRVARFVTPLRRIFPLEPSTILPSKGMMY